MRAEALRRLTTLVALVALVALLPVLAGCVGPGVVAPQEAVAAARRLHIVAMEPHPLGVPPEFNSVVLASGGSLQAARGLALFNAIAVLVELPAASRRGAELSRSLQSSLDQQGEWVPTQVLAQQAQAQLAAGGLAAAVAPQVKAMPGLQDRAYTVTMENWLAPIRAWYNDSSPATDYAQPELQADPSLYVLEVGVINYEISLGPALMLQVAMKLIDPRTGRVLGRARAANPFTMPALGALDQAFADDALRFKAAFNQAGQELTRKCLADLGLVLK